MMKHTHLFMGIVATATVISLNSVILAPIAVLGSVIPDIDYKIGLKHRGVTHTLLALVISSGILTIFSWKLGLLWALNYATHLFLDSITKMGVPIFYPVSKKYYGLKLIKTRGTEDLFLCLILLYIITVWLQ